MRLTVLCVYFRVRFKTKTKICQCTQSQERSKRNEKENEIKKEKRRKWKLNWISKIESQKAKSNLDSGGINSILFIWFFSFFFLGSVSRILFSKYQNEFWIERSIFVLNVSLFIVFRFYATRVTSLRFSIKQDFDLNLNELNEISVYSVVLFLTVVVVVDWTWTRNIWKVWEKNLHC